jgi:hypothetical protein
VIAFSGAAVGVVLERVHAKPKSTSTTIAVLQLSGNAIAFRGGLIISKEKSYSHQQMRIAKAYWHNRPGSQFASGCRGN